MASRGPRSVAADLLALRLWQNYRISSLARGAFENRNPAEHQAKRGAKWAQINFLDNLNKKSYFS